MKYKCPCCDYYTLYEPRADDICPVCFWHDDGEELTDLDYPMGPNGVNLSQGRKNFIDFGACEERVLPYVRPPMDDEKEGFDR